MEKIDSIYHKVYKVKTCGGGSKKLRTCLGCGKDFVSIGKGNRICPKCLSLAGHL